MQNASSLVIAELKKDFPEIHTRILPVDSVIAPARLKQAIRELRPTMLLMLGEAAGSREIRLETTAWNELDFRITDIAGRQPRARPIRKDGPRSLPSTLPFDQIHALLAAADHPVILSQDPGRYLCNQALYVALHFLTIQTQPCSAGFIHLPLEIHFPTDRAADAIRLILCETLAEKAE